MSELDAKPYEHIDAGRGPAAASAPQNLFCIAVYNEPVEPAAATLASLQASLAQARRAALRSTADACLCLVIDGRETMDQGLLQFLLDARLNTPEALRRDGITRLFFASRAPHDLPWPGARCNAGRHGSLMAVLDRTLAALRQRLHAAGLWDDTVVLVYSKFGRRPGENDHGGTVHGMAGPLLLAGGLAQGGVHGPRAALDALDRDGNPRFATDFRSVYATRASGLFGLPVEPSAAADRPLMIRLA